MKPSLFVLIASWIDGLRRFFVYIRIMVVSFCRFYWFKFILLVLVVRIIFSLDGLILIPFHFCSFIRSLSFVSSLFMSGIVCFSLVISFISFRRLLFSLKILKKVFLFPWHPSIVWNGFVFSIWVAHCFVFSRFVSPNQRFRPFRFLPILFPYFIFFFFSCFLSFSSVSFNFMLRYCFRFGYKDVWLKGHDTQSSTFRCTNI